MSKSRLGVLVASGVLVAACSQFVDLDGLDTNALSAQGGSRGQGADGGSGALAANAGSAGAGGASPTTGRDGALSVVGTQAPNQFALLREPGFAGDVTLSLASGGSAPDATWLVPGQRVLLWRPQGADDAVGSEKATNLTGNLGRYALARVGGRSGDSLVLEQPLPFDLPALSDGAGGDVAQLVSVPEYTQVTIPRGAGLVATPWNGSFGGIVTFAADRVVSEGKISADAAGGRGGEASRSGYINCLELNGLGEAGYGGKGEGLSRLHFGAGALAGGPQNFLNGGGGSGCANGGGGGGGHGGSGGRGGHQFFDMAPGQGLPGAGIAYAPQERIAFGGGGGGGGGNAIPGTPGGRGGGIVLLWVGELSGGGTLSADGAAANDAIGGESDAGGAGGGGAGGAIVVHAGGGIACSAASARGGLGGTTTDLQGAAQRYGSGGGGGGGYVALLGATSACPSSVEPGAAGQMTPATPAAHRATDGQAGLITSP